MKRTAIALTLILSFLLSCVLLISIGLSFLSVKADSNNPIVFSGGITMYSPVNTTYHTNFLTLNLTCSCGVGLHFSLNYDIDGKYQGPITLAFNQSTGFQVFALATGLVQLPELPLGSHRLIVYEEAYLNDYHGANPPGAPFKPTAPGSADYVASWIDTVYFTIEDSTPPTITLLTIENTIYNTTNIPLNFTVSESVSQITYSLDGQDNMTVSGNITLTGLSNGEHNVTVYAMDKLGYVGASETVYFTVAVPFPTTLVAVAVIVVAFIISVGLLWYFLIRKHKGE